LNLIDQLNATSGNMSPAKLSVMRHALICIVYVLVLLLCINHIVGKKSNILKYFIWG